MIVLVVRVHDLCKGNLDELYVVCTLIGVVKEIQYHLYCIGCGSLIFN